MLPPRLKHAAPSRLQYLSNQNVACGRVDKIRSQNCSGRAFMHQLGSERKGSQLSQARRTAPEYSLYLSVAWSSTSGALWSLPGPFASAQHNAHTLTLASVTSCRSLINQASAAECTSLSSSTSANPSFTLANLSQRKPLGAGSAIRPGPLQ